MLLHKKNGIIWLELFGHELSMDIHKEQGRDLADSYQRVLEVQEYLTRQSGREEIRSMVSRIFGLVLNQYDAEIENVKLTPNRPPQSEIGM